MQGKIIDSHFSETMRYCEVTKQSKYGTFINSAFCEDEDKDIFNEWDGCRFAEYKCDLEIFYAKIKEFKARLRGMENVYKSLTQTVEETNEVMVKLMKQIRIARRDIDNMQKQYNHLYKQYPDFTESILKEHREIREKISRKHVE